jgi:MFS family permease
MIPFLILVASPLFGYFIRRFSEKEVLGRENILRMASSILLLFVCLYLASSSEFHVETLVFLVFGFLVGERNSEYLNQFCQGILSYGYVALFVPIKILEGSFKKSPYEYLLLLSYFLVPFIPNIFLIYVAYVLMGIGLQKISKEVDSWKGLSKYLSKQTQKSRA